MEQTAVQKLAWVLKILLTITFVLNLLALPLVPVLVSLHSCGVPLHRLLERLSGSTTLFTLLSAAWTIRFSYTLVLTLFLLFCGLCTAVILWQARHVLHTILLGTPFCRENGKSLRLAGICCFLISLFALIRMVWGLFYYGSIAPLLTYNALFVPVFFMGGLLCLVMSALFRQAAVLKEESDLTI